MLYIEKGKEPGSLTQYKKQKYAYFDGYKEKDDVRKQLLKEQGYLCAYCMRRIDLRHMKIEHWIPEKSLTEAEKLDYRNMLGCCLGTIQDSKGEKTLTCDSHKKDTKITVNPLKQSTLRSIQYRSSGEIFSEDPDIEKDLDDTLNLNSSDHLLKENRQRMLQQMILQMSQMQKQGIWGKNMLEKIKEKYMRLDANGQRKEYAGVAIWYLNNKLKSVK